MTKQSELEFIFDVQVTQLAQRLGINPPEREIRFHPTRNWRFDFAWPQRRIAVEIEGGVWSAGRHTRGAGFIGDCEKLNEAARLGWTVYRMPGPWVEGGRAVCYMERVLNGEEVETSCINHAL